MSRILIALAALSLLPAVSLPLAAQAPARVGWEETFDDIARWKAALEKPASGTPMVSVAGIDGCLDFWTPCGALDPNMKRADWPEWPANPASSFTNFEVNYDAAVDFSTYRYLVVRIVEKSTFMLLSVNGKPTKVCYTTGVHAQDLKSLGIEGKQKVLLYGQTLNSSGHVRIDYVRLVSELTDEEKKGLIGEGLTVRDENLRALPYHGLEALNARAGRPARTGGEGSEWCVYRDTATGAEVWKMTDLDANEYQANFNCDGSAFTVFGRGGAAFHIFDWTTRWFEPMEGGMSDANPRFSTTEPASMIVAENTWLKTDAPRKRRVTIFRQNFRTGEKTEIAHFEPKGWIVQELVSSPDSSKMAFGLRESPQVFLIDPDAAADKRVREITLPTRLKGIALLNKDTELGWYNCYTYENWIMDLATGKVSHGNGPCAGGHAVGGPHETIGPYSDLMKILVRNGLHPQTEATANDVRIFANYAKPVDTDYGHVSPNGKWAVTDGVSGDVAGQHLMISVDDPAAVLRVCRHNTSRNDWVTNTYSYSSPDATKIAWVSDQLGNGDIYMAVTGRPPAPTALRADRAADGIDVALSWNGPAGMRELAGYRIYRSDVSGRGFVALNREPIRGTTWTDKGVGAGPFFYLVAAVEPSGIEGNFSNEAPWVEPTLRTFVSKPRTLYIEAEECAWKPPVRLALHGSASGSRYLRYHRASVDEPAVGRIEFKLDLPAGDLAMWLRCCDESKGEKQWKWVRSTADPRKGVVEMTAESPAIDRIAVSNNASFDPNNERPETLPPEPAKTLTVSEAKPQSVRLKWDPSPTLNVARYDVHVGGTDDPASLGNATIIGSSTETTLMDWGLRPGTAYTWRVVAVDSRGNRSMPVAITATTAAQPIQTLVAKADAGTQGKVTFALDVKAEAPFMLWARYCPAYVKDFRVNVEIDGKPAGTWTLRAPYRPMWWTLSAKEAGQEREFVDKISAGGKDVFTLARGAHTVTVILDPASAKATAGEPKLADHQHKLIELTATNDHSLRPEGYDPRADFSKGPKAE